MYFAEVVLEPRHFIGLDLGPYHFIVGEAEDGVGVFMCFLMILKSFVCSWFEPVLRQTSGHGELRGRAFASVD